MFYICICKSLFNYCNSFTHNNRAIKKTCCFIFALFWTYPCLMHIFSCLQLFVFVSIVIKETACTDGHKSCPTAAQRGLCVNSEVANTCRLSCKVCSPKVTCEDKFVGCGVLKANCVNNIFVGNSCAKTCGTCSGENDQG